MLDPLGSAGSLLLNAALLLATALIFDLVAPDGRSDDRRARVLAGLLLGATGITIMAAPWQVDRVVGVTVDTRSVLLSVAGLFFGGLPTAIAAVLMAAFRVQIGGGGVPVGLASIAVASLIGLTWRSRWRDRLVSIRLADLWLMGLATTAAILTLFLALPGGLGRSIIEAAGLTMLLVYPAATALLGRVLVERLWRRTVIRELADERRRLRLAVDAARLGTYELDIDSGRMDISARSAGQLGVGASVRAMPVEELLQRLDADDRAMLEAVLDTYRAGGRVEHQLEIRVPSRDGAWRWLLSAGRLVRDGNDGGPRRISGIHMDITDDHERAALAVEASLERARLLAESDSARRALLSLVEDLRLAQRTQAEALDRYRALVTNAPVPILVNRNGHISLANDALVQLIGAADDSEILGRSPLELFDAADHPRVLQRIATLREERRPVPPAEYWITRRDGERVAVEVSASPFDDHGDISIHVVFRDITEQKRAEAALLSMNTELEGRVQERTSELQSAYRELESFSYSVSHDLRAPLRAITGFSQILNRRYHDQLDETGSHYLDNISTAGERMGALIEDLLEYSRVGRRAVRREPLDVVATTDAVAMTLAQHIIETCATVGTDGEPAVPLGDPTLFQLVLLNLIGNAITYARPDVPPDISIRAVREGDRVAVTVQDNGIGIASEHHERVFEVFARLHTEDEIPGTGIGLAIVRKAARLMEGDVHLESTPGAGSRFILRLAAAPTGGTPREGADGGPSAVPDDRGRTVPT